MNLRTGYLAASLAIASVLTGCTVPRDAGFTDVSELTQERLGRRVDWNRGSPQDQEARQAIEELLDEPLTADAAVQVALLNNRRLQATYEDLGVAQAQLVQAGLLKNPVFHFAPGFPLDGGSTELTFSVTQEFVDVFFMPLRKAVRESEFEAAKLRVTAAVLDKAADTRAAFYTAQAQEQMLEMRQQVAAATEASLAAAKQLREAGNIREVDLHNEQAMHDQARLDLAMAQNEAVESRERLNMLLGLWGADTQWKLGPRLPDIAADLPELERLEAQAVESNLALAATAKMIEALGHQLGYTRAAGLVPSIGLGAEAERDDGHWKVGPSISLGVPLFDQGQTKVAVAQAELRRAQETYAADAIELRAAARIVRQRLVTAHRAAAFYRDQVMPLRQRIVHQTLLNYNAMQVGVFQLLVAKQQQIEAGRRYIEALHAYWLARTDLDLLLKGRTPKVGNESSRINLAPSSMDTGASKGGH